MYHQTIMNFIQIIAVPTQSDPLTFFTPQILTSLLTHGGISIVTILAMGYFVKSISELVRASRGE